MSPTIFLGALLVCAIPSANQPSQTGELVLRAVDIDTAKPVPGVSFSIENSMAEDWARTVGVSDKTGTLRLRTEDQPGYYYSVYPRLKGYDVAGLDDVSITITPGRVATHTFLLRSEKSKPKLPPLIALPADERHRVPTPQRQAKNFNWISSVDDMPGFEGRSVTFWFYPDKSGKISPSKLVEAEKVFINGKRLKAAVLDQLAYFHKAEPEDRGDIDRMNDIRVEVAEHGGKFWCRLPHGMDLRDGYGITFDEKLDHWNLYVPDFQQPNYANRCKTGR
jgi:hypothetical protein